MKTIKQTGLVLAAALMTFACSKPSDTVEATEAQEVTQSEGTTLTMNPSDSKITWMGYKPTGQHIGVIPATTGTVTVNGTEVTGGTFTFDITALEIHDLEAGSEDHGKLHGHLQSDDFFDAANHPTATFEITSVEPFSADDEVTNEEEFASENTPKSNSELAPATPNYWVSGNLTMRGTTKNIKFPAAINVANGVVTTKAGFNIDRTDWGLAYGDEATVADKAKDKFVYNNVGLVLDVKAN
ncbi:YceI-like domain-containing protein [Algoriphagus ratkowskyi]|uniref:YceI family protein n=1 Tax=Algoriphagus ratkowskyi TaxID=57028 RepID=A0A2W7QN72_9BACT|nr:YceI family protein [Algoriphagus ratkowskyi]PZX49551.1 YceI-like domain-containing protein [Algoriphagus ratkowskyi]TXD75416.1 YceI family protein [Algoriphagus ratkowskyi]